jgi:hypothetical protein
MNKTIDNNKETKMRFKHLIILILMSALVIVGCDSQEEVPEEAAPVVETSSTPEPEVTPEVQTAAIKVSVNFDTSSESISFRSFNALGASDDVAAITVEAFRATDGVLITSTELENIDGIWEGTLEELPYGEQLSFSATAYDDSETAIFSGTVSKTLTVGLANDIVFAMASIDDGIDPGNPKILSATLPEKVMIDTSDHLLSFQIDHSSEIEYTIEVTGGRIAGNMGDSPVSVLTGIHNPQQDLEIYYYAPIDALIATISITINDLNGSDQIGTSYSIAVVSTDPDTWTDSGISVLFGPAITGMDITRSETTLKLELTTDPSDGLTYAWTGTGSFADLSATGNPIFIENFSDDQSGNILVTVTDANDIEAFMTRTIEAGEYPYDVNDYVADMPGVYIYDEVTALLWMDNTNKIRRRWSAAQDYCADLTLIDYSVWRLPTANELASMYERRDQFSFYYEDQYWTADEDPDDPDNAIVIDFTDGSQSSDKKGKFKLVRCVKN